MAQYAPVQSDTPSTRVELRISCKNLRDADVFSKSDPLVAVYTPFGFKSWNEVTGAIICMLKWPAATPITFSFTCFQFARTEMIKNTLNPEFTKAIAMDYKFEEQQRLRFCVYDLDNETATLDDDDVLGSLECNLGEVINQLAPSLGLAL